MLACVWGARAGCRLHLSSSDPALPWRGQTSSSRTQPLLPRPACRGRRPPGQGGASPPAPHTAFFSTLYYGTAASRCGTTNLPTLLGHWTLRAIAWGGGCGAHALPSAQAWRPPARSPGGVARVLSFVPAETLACLWQGARRHACPPARLHQTPMLLSHTKPPTCIASLPRPRTLSTRRPTARGGVCRRLPCCLPSAPSAWRADGPRHGHAPALALQCESVRLAGACLVVFWRTAHALRRPAGEGGAAAVARQPGEGHCAARMQPAFLIRETQFGTPRGLRAAQGWVHWVVTVPSSLLGQVWAGPSAAGRGG
jgi:hypothetical protein